MSKTELLVRELVHRIRNDLTCLMSTAMGASVNVVEPNGKLAIAAIVDAIHALARVYRLLELPERDDMIDAAAYMENLCVAITRSKLAESGIKLTLMAQPRGRVRPSVGSAGWL